mmetsp:Transcript_13404/g.20006  ORF Transcript_13404/g.20006 Transcript_13404/m.20006 type:complete len:535 (-) Transcript_13404:280-1884(-)
MCNPLIAGDDFVQSCEIKSEVPNFPMYLRTTAKKKRWRNWERNRAIIKKDIKTREEENIRLRDEEYLHFESNLMERTLFARLAKHLTVLVASTRRQRRLADNIIHFLETRLYDQYKQSKEYISGTTRGGRLAREAVIQKQQENLRHAVTYQLFYDQEEEKCAAQTTKTEQIEICNQNKNDQSTKRIPQEVMAVAQGRQSHIETMAYDDESLAQLWRQIPTHTAGALDELKHRKPNVQSFFKAIQIHTGSWDEELSGIDNVNDMLLASRQNETIDALNFFYGGDDNDQDETVMTQFPHLESRHASSHIDGASKRRIDEAALHPQNAFVSFGTHDMKKRKLDPDLSSRSSWVYQFTPEQLLERCVEKPAKDQAIFTSVYGELSHPEKFVQMKQSKNAISQVEKSSPQISDQRVWLEGAIPWRPTDISKCLERERAAVDALEAAIAAKEARVHLATDELGFVIANATVSQTNNLKIYRQIDEYRALCYQERKARGDQLPRFRRRKRPKKNIDSFQENNYTSQAERERHHRDCAPLTF